MHDGTRAIKSFIKKNIIKNIHNKLGYKKDLLLVCEYPIQQIAWHL
jgi:hypothetical protein